MARLWSLKFRLGLSGVPADRRAWGLEALRHTCSVPAEGAVRCVTVCVCEWHLLSVQAESRRLPRTRPEGTGADARLARLGRHGAVSASALVPAEMSLRTKGAGGRSGRRHQALKGRPSPLHVFPGCGEARGCRTPPWRAPGSEPCRSGRREGSRGGGQGGKVLLRP